MVRYGIIFLEENFIYWHTYVYVVFNPNEGDEIERIQVYLRKCGQTKNIIQHLTNYYKNNRRC